MYTKYKFSFANPIAYTIASFRCCILKKIDKQYLYKFNESTILRKNIQKQKPKKERKKDLTQQNNKNKKQN